MSFVRARSLLLAVLLLAAAPPVALADPEPEVSDGDPEEAPVRDQWDRILGAEIFGGIDTPYGIVGAALVVAPLRNLALDLGGGGSRDGARVAGGVRVLFPFQDSALHIRFGAAGGPLSWEADQAGHTRRTWDFTGFVDISVGYEYRHPVGFYLRLQLGVEHALDSSADTCVREHDGVAESCVGAGHSPIRTYLGLAVGYMFEVLP